MLPLDCDLNIQWEVTRLGKPESFSGKSVRVFLLDPRGRRYSVENVREDNMFYMHIHAYQLHYPGDYVLSISETDKADDRFVSSVSVGRFGESSSYDKVSADGWLHLSSDIAMPECSKLPGTYKVVRMEQ